MSQERSAKGGGNALAVLRAGNGVASLSDEVTGLAGSNAVTYGDSEASRSAGELAAPARRGGAETAVSVARLERNAAPLRVRGRFRPRAPAAQTASEAAGADADVDAGGEAGGTGQDLLTVVANEDGFRITATWAEADGDASSGMAAAPPCRSELLLPGPATMVDRPIVEVVTVDGDPTQALRLVAGEWQRLVRCTAEGWRVEAAGPPGG
jgi:hypothetical protein